MWDGGGEAQYLRPGAEQEDHDQGVGKTDFAAVDGAVAGALDHGEDVMVARVEDDALDGGLFSNTGALGGRGKPIAPWPGIYVWSHLDIL